MRDPSYTSLIMNNPVDMAFTNFYAWATPVDATSLVTAVISHATASKQMRVFEVCCKYNRGLGKLPTEIKHLIGESLCHAQHDHQLGLRKHRGACLDNKCTCNRDSKRCLRDYLKSFPENHRAQAFKKAKKVCVAL